MVDVTRVSEEDPAWFLGFRIAEMDAYNDWLRGAREYSLNDQNEIAKERKEQNNYSKEQENKENAKSINQ